MSACCWATSSGVCNCLRFHFQGPEDSMPPDVGDYVGRRLESHTIPILVCKGSTHVAHLIPAERMLPPFQCHEAQTVTGTDDTGTQQ
eukprot:4744646-Amphidinium_carterae.1